jgi:lysophospholipase L1-like esterase
MKRSLQILLFILPVYLLIACTKGDKNTSIRPSGDPVTGTDTTVHSYLALGDSYTIGQSVTVAERFPVQTIALLKQQGIKFTDAEIIATTGWTTGDLISNMQTTPPKKTAYDIVTLLIGVNNQFQGRSQDEYRIQFEQLLNSSIQYAGNKKSHVIVLSIPDWGVTPYANGYNRQLIAAQIDSFNLINKQIAIQKGVSYIDITPATRLAATDPTLVTYDGLHPSGKEYALWASPLANLIRTVL